MERALGDHEKVHDHLYAAQMGSLSVMDDVILKENFTGTMKCANVEVLETTASQNYHGEWITGVSFS